MFGTSLKTVCDKRFTRGLLYVGVATITTTGGGGFCCCLEEYCCFHHIPLYTGLSEKKGEQGTESVLGQREWGARGKGMRVGTVAKKDNNGSTPWWLGVFQGFSLGCKTLFLNDVRRRLNGSENETHHEVTRMVLKCLSTFRAGIMESV